MARAMKVKPPIAPSTPARILSDPAGITHREEACLCPLPFPMGKNLERQTDKDRTERGDWLGTAIQSALERSGGQASQSMNSMPTDRAGSRFT